MIPFCVRVARVLVLAFLFWLSLACQTSGQTWQTEVVVDNVMGGFERMATTQDGRVFLGGTILGGPAAVGMEHAGEDSLWISRLDQWGEIVWSNLYRPSDSSVGPRTPVFGDLVMAADGNLYVLASLASLHGWVLKLTPEGEVIWSRRIKLPGEFLASRMVATPGGGVIVLGTSENESVLLWLSSSGSVVRSKRYPTGAVARSSAITLFEDGDVVFTSTEWEPPVANPFRSWIVRVNGAGKVLAASTAQSFEVANCAPHTDSSLILYGDRYTTTQLVQLNDALELDKVIRYEFPGLFGSDALDMHSNLSGGWTISATEEGDGLWVVRVNAEMEPVWRTAFPAKSDLMGHVGEIFGDLSSPKVIVAQAGTWVFPNRTSVSALNYEGKILDSCSVAYGGIEHGPSVLTVEAAAVTASDVSTTTEPIETLVAGVVGDQLFLCDDALEPFEFQRPIPRVPLRMCIDPDILFPPCPDFVEPCVEPWPRGVGIPLGPDCHDDPGCERCLLSLANGSEYLANPDYRARLYQTLPPFLERRWSELDSGEIRATAAALREVPVGRYFTDTAKAAITAHLEHLVVPRKPGSPTGRDLDPLPHLAAVCNRITLDIVAPPIGEAVVEGSTARFGALASVSFESLPAYQKDLRLEIDAGSPAGLARYAAGLPAVAFSLRSERELPPGEATSISLYYGGMRFEGPDERLRLLHWDGNRYEEITVAIDTREQRIAGVALGFGTFVICAAPE